MEEDGRSSTDHLSNFAAGPLDEFHLVFIYQAPAGVCRAGDKA